MKLISLMMLTLLLTGCASQSDVNAGEIAGFWFGLWNGITLSFALIGSMFSDNILIYYPLNKGLLYDLGYVIGIHGLTLGFRVTRK